MGRQLRADHAQKKEPGGYGGGGGGRGGGGKNKINFIIHSTLTLSRIKSHKRNIKLHHSGGRGGGRGGGDRYGGSNNGASDGSFGSW